MSPLFGILPLESLGAAIALNRYIALNSKVYFAATTLTQSFKSEHVDLWGDNVENPIFLRSMYFEQAIEAYNKVPDYIYQILYFNFDLYEKLDNKIIRNKKDVQNRAKSIAGRERLTKIRDEISEFGEKEKLFISKFQEYFSTLGHTRNLANDIKHRGCIAIEGTHTSWGKASKPINDVEINLTEIVEPEPINLEDEIAKLVSVHESTHEILQDLYKLCNFEQQLNRFLKSNL